MASRIPDGRRVFAFVPTRSKLVPASICFDTIALGFTFGLTQAQTESLVDPSELWGAVFKLGMCMLLF